MRISGAHGTTVIFATRASAAARVAHVGHVVFRRTRAPLAAAALAIVTSACAHYEPRPLQPATSAHAFAARRLDAADLGDAVRPLLGARAGAWPPAVWDRADLLAVALVQNPQLAVARAEMQESLAHEISAAQTPNPDVTLQSEYARREPYSWLYGIGLDFLLRSPTEKRLGIDIAKLATANARWQIVEKTWDVRHALIDALGDVEGARRRGAMLDRLVGAQQHLLGLQQDRVKAGEDSPAELVVVRASVLEIEQQRAQVRVESAAAQSALAAVLGLPPEALDGIAIEWTDWGSPPALDDAALPQLREQALLSRADLAASIGDYASSEHKLELAIARQYPQIHLSPGWYWDHGVAKWPLDVGTALPIFNRNEGEIAEARAARDTAAQRMLATQAAIYGAIAAAGRAEAVAVDNVDAAMRRVDAAGVANRHAELGLELGAIDRSERLGADVIALRAELDVLTARAQCQAARNALEDALHAPLGGPERELRSALTSAAPAAVAAPDNGGRP